MKWLAGLLVDLPDGLAQLRNSCGDSSGCVEENSHCLSVITLKALIVFYDYNRFVRQSL